MTPTPGPEITPDRPEPAQGVSEALRDRIEAAMRRDDFSIATMANAVLPVVEAETGALTHLLRKTEDELHEARTHAEQAERERDDARAELDKAMQGAALAINLAGRQAADDRTRAEKAEAAVEWVRALHVRHDCTTHVKTSTPVPCVNHGICEGCGALPGYPCRTLIVLDQPEAAP
ncbi:hypothetical protein GCM10010182_67410 [Actinomadura cremea]|nr:hypothetical protein GCM10010182_67410 [Actinomadura cremea]